jgi:membrane protease YdiL (CAAX protease family)
MTQTPADVTSSNTFAFYRAQWQTKWVVIGIMAVLLWRSTTLFDREWIARVAPWLGLVLGGLAQAFWLLFPIMTRNRRPPAALRLPPARRWLIEFLMVVPVVIGATLLLWTVDSFLARKSPGTSLTPDAIKNLARFGNPTVVYPLLLFMVACSPIAEEVFFRGFLQNAFRARMPWIVAAICQSLLFGFAHFFGVVHAIAAVVVGLICTLIYEWRKQLLAPIFAHAGFNLVAAIGVLLTMAAREDSPVMGVTGDPKDAVCVVRRIVPGSAAEEAGLRIGDTIESLDGTAIRDLSHLIDTVHLYRPHDIVSLVVRRNGSSLRVDVELQRRGDVDVSN